MNPSAVRNVDYLPFGELNSGNSGYTTHMFTGDERDAETGLDERLARAGVETSAIFPGIS